MKPNPVFIGMGVQSFIVALLLTANNLISPFQQCIAGILFIGVAFIIRPRE
jgi:hypothetical protein